ncbi:uncharacterized protein PHALS_00937 [Plasmopara halstedii]|uniref:Uncharacterized protein n=1 Tax=Plasmopara halstedii TaxID=4781 RepID=A0A0N7L6L2_PLAHL|nr:uncharacterized protein PHALS_00937 [Plasmopara halstedii]CEG44587.1 hypothetical protein PHALS_00937 [Plasmopara halstedii]|eukprot:XP_024580956.1 hypothetical protein PHALS_00937 [Plasmopara halstedii]
MSRNLAHIPICAAGDSRSDPYTCCALSCTIYFSPCGSKDRSITRRKFQKRQGDCADVGTRPLALRFT